MSTPDDWDQADCIIVRHAACGKTLFWAVDVQETRADIADAMYRSFGTDDRVERLTSEQNKAERGGFCSCFAEQTS